MLGAVCCRRLVPRAMQPRGFGRRRIEARLQGGQQLHAYRSVLGLRSQVFILSRVEVIHQRAIVVAVELLADQPAGSRADIAPFASVDRAVEVNPSSVPPRLDAHSITLGGVGVLVLMCWLV